METNIEYLTGQDHHSSNWAKFHVKGLEKWAVREMDDEPKSGKHAYYQFYVCLDVPEGTIFTIFEQDGDKYGTDTFNFYLCEAVSETGKIEGAYDRHCSGNFRVICLGAGKTKAPRLMDWWGQYIDENSSNERKYQFAVHCSEHINKRGQRNVPPFEYQEKITSK